ncbi:MAG: UbiA family prenyltransferase [Planctomycetes bacterium]|nr:UbiA family prenyltransferase [Planctomycetota bacterium]
MRPWLQLIRVQNLPTALADIWAGYAVGWMICLYYPHFRDFYLQHGIDLDAIDGDPLKLFLAGLPPLFPLAAASAASILLYAGGVVLNDYVDRDRDRKSASQRPLPSGAISPVAALVAALTLLLAGFAVTLSIPVPLVVSGSLVAAIVAYDLGLKSLALGGSLALGMARGLNWFLGFSASGAFDIVSWLRPTFNDGEAVLYSAVGDPACLSRIPPEVALIPVSLAVFAFAITWASTAEEEGGRVRERIVACLVLLLLVSWLSVVISEDMLLGRCFPEWDPSVPKEWTLMVPSRPIAALLSAMLSLAFLSAGIPALRKPSPSTVGRLVLVGVRGYPVLHASLLLGLGCPLAASAMLSLLLLSMVLGMWIRGS